MTSTIVAQALLLIKRNSQFTQQNFFRSLGQAESEAVAFKLLRSVIDDDKGRVVVVFWEHNAYNIVFEDEVVPFSAEVDEAYREFRREHYGRTSDIESFAVRGGKLCSQETQPSLTLSSRRVFTGTTNNRSAERSTRTPGTGCCLLYQHLISS